MSDFNWCHGPKCHTKHTVDRVRGVKGSKVLRTRKIKINNWNKDNVWSHFCSQGCYTDFMNTYWASKHKKHITRKGQHNDKCRFGHTKKGVPYYVYYDLDALGYRTATTSWKVRH